MIVDGTRTRETGVSAIGASSGVGPRSESFEAVLDALAAHSVTPSLSPHLGGDSGGQDNMALTGWRDRLPFGRNRPSTSNEPLDDVVHGLARVLKDSVNDSRETQEALDRFIREFLHGGEESEFSSLMSPMGNVATKVEHAVAGFGKVAGNYVANHAEEIGLSAGAAAAVGGAAALTVDALGGLGALGAAF